MIKHALVVVAYIFSTFVTQATSHFVVNAEHYASIAYMRAEPIMPLGVLAMLVQGLALSYLHSRSEFAGRSMMSSLIFSWLAGAILVSYIAFAEAAKYAVPAVGSWLATEVIWGFIQFTIFGLLLGLIYARQRHSKAVAA